jgi:hypothetical protein
MTWTSPSRRALRGRSEAGCSGRRSGVSGTRRKTMTSSTLSNDACLVDVRSATAKTCD